MSLRTPPKPIVVSPDFTNRYVSFVLVRPENPENIGAAARAIKNMGFSELRLVCPPAGWKRKGRKMAMSAVDVLDNAEEFSDLDQALRGAHLCLGTTRRYGARRGRGCFLEFDRAIQKMKKANERYQVAVLFGRESKGLSNLDLSACDWVTTLPAHPIYPSINLAQAVMLVAFCLFKEKKGNLYGEGPSGGNIFSDQRGVLDVLKRFRAALESLEYDKRRGNLVERIVKTFRGLVKREGLLESEAQMFRGLFRRIDEKVSKKSKKL